jgi:hypothetical protein
LLQQKALQILMQSEHVTEIFAHIIIKNNRDERSYGPALNVLGFFKIKEVATYSAAHQLKQMGTPKEKILICLKILRKEDEGCKLKA